ncbi:MAG TPA: hypothetical protein PLO37_08130 [Candidatus Hydrogenedentes bacterium]|nr:hypothetical protein [Candidatus Hydrogenedentota bacterium]HPG66799.1 hypothetical protein [Candidatus Hydrogenedentota bacterium]
MSLSKKQLRVVAELERRVEMTREFMNDWLLFNEIMSAYPRQGVNKAQLENQFLKIKSKLAREFRVLKDTLGLDYTIDADAMNIVAGATSLEAIYVQSDVAIKKLQSEWHRAFISINETLGGIEDKKARAEAGEKIFITEAGTGAVAKSGGMSDKTKKNLIIIVIVVAIIAALFVIPSPIRDIYLDALHDLGIGPGSGKNPML